jgi:hypothetical protein
MLWGLMLMCQQLSRILSGTELRKCSVCNLEKPIEDFPKRGKGILDRRKMCNDCYKEKRRESWRKHDLIRNSRRREQWKNNPEYRERNKHAVARYRKRNHEILIEKSRYNWNVIRTTVIMRYGGKCTCCGEVSIEFLALDHINGGGNKLRKEKGHMPSKLYRVLYKQTELDPSFRILCHNCNTSYGHYGYCPHQSRSK